MYKISDLTLLLFVIVHITENLFASTYLYFGDTLGQFHMLGVNSNLFGSFHLHPNVNIGVLPPSHLNNSQARLKIRQPFPQSPHTVLQTFSDLSVKLMKGEEI